MANTLITRSEPSFFRLVPYDLAGSRAHARELARAGILSDTETQQLIETTEITDQEFRSGTLTWTQADEDVHTFLERELTTRLGALGGRLRAGRSRNDQAANNLRLYLRDHAPELLAAELGYTGPCENSTDAVASRDHVAEFVFVTSMLAVKLSRLSEEIILWTSKQFGWVRLDDGYATGSSIMPQKKNSDIAELTRGKAGRLIGNLAGLLATLKSLPLAYNRDLAEDKAAAFDSIDTLKLVLPAMAAMVRTMTANVDEMRRQAPLGFTLATELADWLLVQGMPFSEAHEITGRVVLACEAVGVDLTEVSLALLQGVDARFEESVLTHLTLDAAIHARKGFGGTSPVRVAEQIARLQAATARQSSWIQIYEGPV